MTPGQFFDQALSIITGLLGFMAFSGTIHPSPEVVAGGVFIAISGVFHLRSQR